MDVPYLGVIESGSDCVPSRAAGYGSFDALFEAEYESMVRVAFLMLGDREQSEDVVQDAFARVIVKWGSVRQPGAYLRTSVVNGSRDVLRRRHVARRAARRLHVDSEEPPEFVLDLLDQLSPRQRAAIVLRYFEDLSEAEIARILRVRPGTVKSLLHRGLARIRRTMEDQRP